MENKFELTQINVTSFEVMEAGTGATVRESTTVDETKLFNAVSSASEPVKNYLDKVVEVEDIIITSVDVNEDVNDEESDIVSVPVVHFYTTDGKHISTLSKGVIRTVKSLFELGMTPSPERPRKIRFKTTQTKRGTAHVFELVKD